MMRITLVLLLSALLLQLGRTVGTVGGSAHKHEKPSDEKPEPDTSSLTPPPTPHHKAPPPSLLSQECVDEKHTRSSCTKVFCPPWERCINGQCVCKLPYQCPRFGPRVCGLEGRSYMSLCQAQANACREKRPLFSHYTDLGSCEEPFKVELRGLKGQQVVQFRTADVTALVCGSDSWNMAAANVVCKHNKNNPSLRGAKVFGKSEFKDIMGVSRVHECVDVRCTGAERTLAECLLYKPRSISEDTSVATVTCYTNEPAVGKDECDGFHCVNEKCVSWEHICDGVDDCGDNSDEMCCTGCQNGAFYCKSGVCLPPYAVQDKIRDCLGGEDEIETVETVRKSIPRSGSRKEHLGSEEPKTEVWTNSKDDILKIRNHTETLECGIPNMDYVHKTEEETRRRTKRVVGGEEAMPTQIQWQVAIQEDEKIHCGGAYLGGCWVLTAAHCVRPKPQSFRIKFSLWQKISLLTTTDSVPVKNIIIHREYNPRTYENDIALIQLEELAYEKECLHPNPAVRPVCVPWSPLQFPANYTCTISGWGRNKQGDSVNILRWANVSLIPNCESYYKERYHKGMMCAGDLEGNVDSCQGDSGGPLVCKDASGVSYVWGIVSWGDKCGEAGFPGVYTQVAHYFEWIRQQTGWPAVTKYNQ
ncbi:complement factor I-like [Clarias gariepinus]|uniref:complement factor I-like n=1 Tax=Clarias gariepinus TaxID=13013 RepID=UPI00234E03FB|nr:complement factor I-like [Clarias gariepinus]